MITLATIAFEKNFDYILDKSWFINYKSSLIKEKLLIVNNIDTWSRFIEKLRLHPELRVVFVDGEKEKIKQELGISFEKEEEVGYNYAMGYYTMIVACKTKFLFNVTSDIVPKFKRDFLINSVKELKNNDNMYFTTLSNNVSGLNDGIGEEERSFREHYAPLPSKNFFNSIFFTDRLFFTSMEKVKKINFNLPRREIIGMTFPAYCGERCFEKQVSNFLQTEKKYRGIYKKTLEQGYNYQIINEVDKEYYNQCL